LSSRLDDRGGYAIAMVGFREFAKTLAVAHLPSGSLNRLIFVNRRGNLPSFFYNFIISTGSNQQIDKATVGIAGVKKQLCFLTMASCVVTTGSFCSITDSSIRLKSSKLVHLVRLLNLKIPLWFLLLLSYNH